MNKIRDFILLNWKKLREEYQESRIVSFGVFAIILVLILILVSQVVNSYTRRTGQEIRVLMNKIHYQASLKASRDGLDTDQEALRAAWADFASRIYMLNSNEPAFSDLLRQVELMCKNSSATIRSYDLSEPRTSGEFVILPLYLDLNVTYENLVLLIKAMDDYQKYIKIADMEIRKLLNTNNLVVRLTVEAVRYDENQSQ